MSEPSPGFLTGVCCTIIFCCPCVAVLCAGTLVYAAFESCWKCLFSRDWEGLEDLPPGVLARICDRLPADDLPRLRQVCRSLRTAANHRVRRAEITMEVERGGEWSLSFPFLTALAVHHVGSCRLPVHRLNDALRHLQHLTDLELHGVRPCLTRQSRSPGQAWRPAVRSQQRVGWEGCVALQGSARRLAGLVLPQQVTRLRLRSFDSPDADLAAAQVRRLRCLRLHDCRELRWDVFQQLVAELSNSLVELALRNTDFTAAARGMDWRVLNPERLQTLTLCGLRSQGYGLPAAALAHLAACTSLTSLDLSLNPWLGSADVGQLAALTRLSRLDVSGSAVSEAGVRQLAGLTQLADLGVGGVRGGEGGLLGAPFFGALAGLPLTHLDVSGCQLTDANRCFALLPRLARLTADDSNLLEQSAALGGLGRLRALSLQHCLERSPRSDLGAPSRYRADIQLGYLTGLVGLTSLDLSRPAQVPHHTRVIELHAGLDALAQLTALLHLCLSGGFSVGGRQTLAALAPLTALTRLDLQCVRWRRCALQQLEPLEHLPALKVLRLNNEIAKQQEVAWLPPHLRRAMEVGSRLRG